MINLIIAISFLFLSLFFGSRAVNDFGYNFNPKDKLLSKFALFKKIQPLVLEPYQKQITASEVIGNWNENFFIYLTNNTNKTYYDVSISSEFPNSIDVSFLPTEPSGESFIPSKSGNIIIGADFMVVGENPTDKIKHIQTLINNIGPNEKKKIGVIVNKINSDKNFNLIFKIDNFSEDPKPIFNK